MNRTVLLILVGLFSMLAMAADSSSRPVFQLRLVADGPSDNAEPMVVVDPSKDADQRETLYVSKKILIDQAAVKSARVFEDKQTGRPQIDLRFTTEGAKQFAAVTRDHKGQRLAIVIGGQLYSAPKIMTEISSGAAIISGNFGLKEAHELVAKINGALDKK